LGLRIETVRGAVAELVRMKISGIKANDFINPSSEIVSILYAKPEALFA
jgi:hypothetical protein